MKSDSCAAVTTPALASPRLALVVAAPALAIDGALIAQLHPTLLRVAQRMVSNPAHAEDIVQETWLSAISCAHSYQGRSTVLTWLIAIMRRRVCDLRRKSRRRMQELDESCCIVEASWAEPFHARDNLQSLEAAFAQLTELEREAILLCDVRDSEREAAAQELNVSRGHLRVLLHRGHQRIREAVRSTNVR